jgi:hypothetical protein
MTRHVHIREPDLHGQAHLPKHRLRGITGHAAQDIGFNITLNTVMLFGSLS